MNRKGFTLIELIVAIGLLAILGTMIASNMLGVQSRQMQSNYESYKEQIAEAACLLIDSKYVETKVVFKRLTDDKKLENPVSSKSECLNNICYTKTSYLIDNGFLDKDLENPVTGISVTNNEFVEIKYVNGVKNCTYISET